MGKSKHCTSETNKTKTQANANIYPSYSNYEGASHADTRTRNWKAPILGPNIEFNEWEQYSLIARSRDLYRNFPLIHACIDRMIDYIIGTGIKFQPRLRNEDFPDYSPEELLEISREIKEKFYVWGESCGVDSRFSFFELQRQIAFSMLVSGECFWNSTFINDKLRIQLFEPERVSLPDNQIETKFLSKVHHLCQGTNGCNDLAVTWACLPLWWTLFSEECGLGENLHNLRTLGLSEAGGVALLLQSLLFKKRFLFCIGV